MSLLGWGTCKQDQTIHFQSINVIGWSTTNLLVIPKINGRHCVKQSVIMCKVTFVPLESFKMFRLRSKYRNSYLSDSHINQIVRKKTNSMISVPWLLEHSSFSSSSSSSSLDHMSLTQLWLRQSVYIFTITALQLCIKAHATSQWIIESLSLRPQCRMINLQYCSSTCTAWWGDAKQSSLLKMRNKVKPLLALRQHRQHVSRDRVILQDWHTKSLLLQQAWKGRAGQGRQVADTVTFFTASVEEFYKASVHRMLYGLSGCPAYLPPLAVIESFAFASFTRPSIDLMTSPALASASSATATLPVESETVIMMLMNFCVMLLLYNAHWRTFFTIW